MSTASARLYEIAIACNVHLRTRDPWARSTGGLRGHCVDAGQLKALAPAVNAVATEGGTFLRRWLMPHHGRAITDAVHVVVIN